MFRLFRSAIDFLVGVNSNGKFMEEFSNSDKEKMDQYANAIVSGIHVLDQDRFAVNKEI